MVAIFTGSEIFNWSGRNPYSPQEEYAMKEGKEIVFHWDNESRYIRMMCNNICCTHHRSWDLKSASTVDCRLQEHVLNDLTTFKVPSNMIETLAKSSIGRIGFAPAPKNMPDEKKKCFKYEENTTSVW